MVRDGVAGTSVGMLGMYVWVSVGDEVKDVRWWVLCSVWQLGEWDTGVVAVLAISG